MADSKENEENKNERSRNPPTKDKRKRNGSSTSDDYIEEYFRSLATPPKRSRMVGTPDEITVFAVNQVQYIPPHAGVPPPQVPPQPADPPTRQDLKRGYYYLAETLLERPANQAAAAQYIGDLHEEYRGGDKGDKGDKGDQGDRGEKGDRGDQGEQGERGARGKRAHDNELVLNQMARQMATISELLTNMSEDMAILKTDVNTLTTNVTTLTTDVTTLTTDVTTLTTDVTTLKTDVKTLKTAVQGINLRLGNLCENMSSATSMVHAVPRDRDGLLPAGFPVEKALFLALSVEDIQGLLHFYELEETGSPTEIRTRLWQHFCLKIN